MRHPRPRPVSGHRSAPRRGNQAWCRQRAVADAGSHAGPNCDARLRPIACWPASLVSTAAISAANSIDRSLTTTVRLRTSWRIERQVPDRVLAQWRRFGALRVTVAPHTTIRSHFSNCLSSRLTRACTGRSSARASIFGRARATWRWVTGWPDRACEVALLQRLVQPSGRRRWRSH